jgi:hypothetical protein
LLDYIKKRTIMKKFLLLTAFGLLATAGAFAQSATKYCDLVVYRPGFKNYVAEMHVDGNSRTKESLVRDASGAPMKFASEADAINYLAKQGWELVTAYSRSSETHFFLKKNG